MARSNRYRDKNLIDDKLLERFKFEIADELGLTDKIQSVGWANMTSRDCGRIGGRIGGNMTKIMVRHAQKMLTDNSEF